MTDDVKVTKLPPGVVPGAGDLQNWSRQRARGRSGVHTPKNERKTLERWTKPKKDAADRWLERHERKE